MCLWQKDYCEIHRTHTVDTQLIICVQDVAVWSQDRCYASQDTNKCQKKLLTDFCEHTGMVPDDTDRGPTVTNGLSYICTTRLSTLYKWKDKTGMVAGYFNGKYVINRGQQRY